MGAIRKHKRAFVKQDDGSYLRQTGTVLLRRERDRPTWEVVRPDSGTVVRPDSGTVVRRGEADKDAAREIGRAL